MHTPAAMNARHANQANVLRNDVGKLLNVPLYHCPLHHRHAAREYRVVRATTDYFLPMPEISPSTDKYDDWPRQPRPNGNGIENGIPNDIGDNRKLHIMSIN